MVLCTATQPLLHTVRKINYKPKVDFGNEANWVGSLNFGKVPTPIIENCEEYFRDLKRTEIIDARKSDGYAHHELAEFICQRQEEEGSVLIIVNTKKDAKLLYDEVKERTGVKVVHLSTSMCPQHRRDILADIRKYLDDKGSTENVICISTQLIEAGVDISFPCVIHALAGVDSIAQAAGRCNRSGRGTCKNVYVVNIRDENLSRLKDIETARDKARIVLDEKPKDLLETDAMTRYYNLYYYENMNQMYYSLKKGSGIGSKNVKLFNLLDDNFAGTNEAKYNRIDTRRYSMKQAFKEAGREFSVIDENTKSVLVPYKEGEKLIKQLSNERIHPKELRKKLKEAQQYCVSVYDWERKKLSEEKYLHEPPNGILYVDEECYDSELGLLIKDRENKLLMC